MTLRNEGQRDTISLELDIEARYRHVLVRFFARKLNDSSVAEDLAQEVLARLVANKNQDIANHDAYVFQIAGNLTRDLLRRQAVRERYLNEKQGELDIGVETINPEQIVGAKRQLDMLIEAVDCLPEPTRRIFILCKFENIKIQSVADELGISASTVKNHLSKALMRLTDMREPEGE